MIKNLFLFSALFLSTIVWGQDCVSIELDAADRVSKDIEFLASDELEGRAPGTQGARVAADYIANIFRESGLQTTEGGSYLQQFELAENVFVDYAQSKLLVNKKEVKGGEGFYPVQFSANENVSGKAIYVGFGITAPDLEYDDYAGIKEKNLAGRIFVMDVSSPDGIHPHSKYLKYHDLEDRISLAKEKGAIGVILVNAGTMASDLSKNFRKIRSQGIPVVFLKDEKLKAKPQKIKKATLNVVMEESYVEAFNVVGLLDLGARNSIVIGAHYDHLGWGAENSLYRGEKAIHNGADDNASGTAGLLELVRYYTSKGTSKYNIVFVAFTGEEKGLLGSNYFVNNFDGLDDVNYMLNMDMIGRLEKKELAISGVGTSPTWKMAFEDAQCDLDLRMSESGVGPSDHTSFYNKGIPVLHFFTGTHDDYHKPSDDAEKINARGIVQVLNLMVYVVGAVEQISIDKLEFTPTKNDQSRKAPKFSVTLGIVPDYMYEDGGVKADGVTEGRPAHAAGLQPGDIIVKIGEIKVKDMHGYMNALAQFKKGDSADIEFKRDGKIQKAKVQF